ncbi:family 43 glycosylhydrolase [Actinotalea subterranea]|uniref:family 43 glycosylhydrolase n=1 Tax=Actinotalea subterranea TaxID=2607497 RepID=UPI00165E326B|nr:family 43 glycosylhydrolase [Actinotalea subterranea]
MQRIALVSVLAAAALAAGLPLGAPGAPPRSDDSDAARGGPGRAPATYTNPVSAGFADTYADPAVIRGKDGLWYAYGTTDPLREGDERSMLPISRSSDLVTWEHVGDAFADGALPAWADAERGAALWAPDVRYVDGEYRLYYVVTETTLTPEPNDNAIGVATAPSPAGPWTDTGAPVVGPRHGAGGEGDFLWTFDPSHVSAPDGTEYLFYGSYYGGIHVTALSDDGRTAVGEPTPVAVDNKYEGAYVVRRGGYWYLFASSANCCAGPTTGYSVHVGRSEQVTGPYVDREGARLDVSRAGGTPVLAPNGNRWVGTGHNAVVTDLAGQDWMVYHAIDREDPYLEGTDGINERPMLLDRLDWVDGWPSVRAGAWASQGQEVAPVTSGRQVTGLEDGLGRGLGHAWRLAGPWTATRDADSGGLAQAGGEAALVTRRTIAQPVRVEADVRLAEGDEPTTAGLVAGSRHQGDAIRAVVDPVAGELVVTVEARGAEVARAAGPLPSGFAASAWHSAVLEVADGVARAEVSDARLGDATEVRLALPDGTRTAGAAGVVAGGPGVQVDNVSVLPRAIPVADVVPVPVPGIPDPAASDELDGTALGAGWTALRDPDVRVEGGSLVWPTEAADLVGTGNDAGVLLRDPPDGAWTAETRVTIDLGTDDVRNFQQAGLVAYVDDDRWARLSHVAIWNTRQTEFGTEVPYAGRLAFGGTIVGPPADTTWLRLSLRVRDGEQEVQAFTSTDGATWVAGGVWTFPADADVKVGLVSHGGAGATAQFDYLRLYRDLTPG